MRLPYDIMRAVGTGAMTMADGIAAQRRRREGQTVSIPSPRPCNGTLWAEFRPAAAWIGGHGSAGLRARLQLHQETVEPRCPEDEGGDGTLQRCVVKRLRAQIVAAARAEGFVAEPAPAVAS